MDIDAIPFSYFNIQEANQFGTTVSSQLTARHPKDPWTRELVSDLVGPLDRTQDAIGSSTKKEGTEEIQAADELVNNSYLGLRKVVFDYEYCPLEAERAAARLLIPIFTQNDLQLYHKGYDEQAAKLGSLFADLGKPRPKAALETLHLTVWKDTLETQLHSLEGLRQQRTGTNATLETPTDKAAKAELIETIKFVLSDINTLVRRNKVPGLDETDKILETSAKEIAAKARARRTRNANSSSDDPLTTE